jgi:hypothetical protein
MKIFPTCAQWNKWTLPSKATYISLWIGLIALLIAVYTILFQNTLTKEDIKSFATRDDIDSILSAQLKNLTLFSVPEFSQSYPGYSFQMMIYLEKQKTKRRKFIFDSGEFQDRNRISLYLDENNNLCFRIIDQNKESHTLVVPEGKDTFRFDELMFLVCEYVIIGNKSLMKIFVNLKDIGNIELPFNLQLASEINLKNTNIGCDLKGENCCSFVISTFSNGRKTLTTNQKIAFFNAVKKYFESVNAKWAKHIRD